MAFIGTGKLWAFSGMVWVGTPWLVGVPDLRRDTSLSSSMADTETLFFGSSPLSSIYRPVFRQQLFVLHLIQICLPVGRDLVPSGGFCRFFLCRPCAGLGRWCDRCHLRHWRSVTSHELRDGSQLHCDFRFSTTLWLLENLYWWDDGEVVGNSYSLRFIKMSLILY